MRLEPVLKGKFNIYQTTAMLRDTKMKAMSWKSPFRFFWSTLCLFRANAAVKGLIQNLDRSGVSQEQQQQVTKRHTIKFNYRDT